MESPMKKQIDYPNSIIMEFHKFEIQKNDWINGLNMS